MITVPKPQDLSPRLRHAAKQAVATTARVSGAARVPRPRRYRHSVAIAMYHGLTSSPLEVDEWCFLDEKTFTAHMNYLARHFTVVHVEDTLDAARNAPGKPIAAVTFDDGFASVFEIAWPVLRRLGIPATVYTVTDLIDTDQTVWFGAVHQAISTSTADQIDVLGVSHRLGSSRERARLSQQIQLALKPFGATEFDALVADLLEQLGVEVNVHRAPHLRMLSSDQIRLMAQDGLIRFGGHTVSHRILSRLSDEAADHEIRTSVEMIDRITGSSSSTFAYPNGTTEDFGHVAQASLCALGLPMAVTTVEGPNWPSTDPYRLRRYGISSRHSLSDFAWKMHHSTAKLSQALRRPTAAVGGAS